ncbi:MAG TPA: B12-binding domain-containing radical SAM protein [Pyrinomonadaceae bacterium]|nr:B12-binding domain-containing radical SAM protein [Pyrinomonadaceae bacterium]
MKALLVYPEFPDTYWSFRHALKFEGRQSAFPPLGLLTVSAMLPRAWERRLVDMNVRRLTDADIEWADIVFVSAMIVQKESLERVVEMCKARGKRTVVGGPYVSTSAEHLPEADHIFVGEAETTLPDFLRDFESGETKRIYQAAERPTLNLTPIPDFRLAELGRYSAMSVQYSRGCPFQCEFCDIIEIYGRVPRTKSNEQMLAELDALREVGWRGLVFIVDDNFIGNKRNVKRLLPELVEWSDAHGRPFSFITEASVNLAEDDALLELMRRANFRRVFLGIETPVEESLKEAQKGQNTRRDLLESVRKIQSYGLEVMAGFIVGFDNDPEDIFERQINFIRESAIPLAMVGLLTALPDTQLWRRLKREGRLLKESSGNNTEGSLNFVPRMDTARLVEGYQRILRTIYSPAEYYQRALDCLSHLTQGPEPRRSRFTDDVKAFVRVAVALGVRDPARAEFWRYMKSAVTTHRRNFAHAVTLAAMGYHFRKLTEAL